MTNCDCDGAIPYSCDYGREVQYPLSDRTPYGSYPTEICQLISGKRVTVMRLDVPRGAVFQVVDYSTPRTFLMTG